MRFIRTLLFVSLIATAGVIGSFFFLTTIPWVDFSVLETSTKGKPSVLIDDEGREWARFQIEHKQPIAFDRIPARVIHAFLAAEDRNFFSHGGLSLRGIIRSAAVNLLRGKKAQGASTITQQLVRLLFFDQQKTFRRKIKEQLIAVAVEHQYTKEFILETYLNNLYFGCGIYGIQAACERFWNKSVDRISTDEAATLAAIIACPARYCPLLNPLNTYNRRNVILHCMHECGFISAEEYKAACATPVAVTAPQQKTCAPHAREHIRLFLEELVGREALYTGGLIIQTTLNQKLQRTASDLFTQHFKKLKKRLGDDVDGALLSLDVKTGAIKAAIGGCAFEESQFDRAFVARRQIGSIVKPIIYAAALEHGFDFDAIEVDEPMMITDRGQPWTPRNYNNKFEGPMTLAHALAASKNTVTLKMLLRVGIPEAAEYIKRFLPTETVEPYPSLALGCIDSTLINATAMFNVFPDKGVYVEPYLIEWVKDRQGKKIWKHRPLAQTVIRSKTSSKVVQALSNNFEHLKKTHPDLFDGLGAVCGKTGTTNQSRTCWFVGATPTLTTGVYIGRDNNQSLGSGVYPNSTVLPLWLDFNRHTAPIDQTFEYDSSLEIVSIDSITGAQISGNSTSGTQIDPHASDASVRDPVTDPHEDGSPKSRIMRILKEKK